MLRVRECIASLAKSLTQEIDKTNLRFGMLSPVLPYAKTCLPGIKILLYIRKHLNKSILAFLGGHAPRPPLARCGLYSRSLYTRGCLSIHSTFFFLGRTLLITVNTVTIRTLWAASGLLSNRQLRFLKFPANCFFDELICTSKVTTVLLVEVPGTPSFSTIEETKSNS